MPIKHLYFVASAFLLGLGAVLSKLVLSAGFVNGAAPPPFVVLTIQLLAGVTFLLAIRLRTAGEVDWFSHFKRPALAGVVLGIGSIGTILAIALVSASEASLVFATQPVVGLGLAWLLLAERVGATVVFLCFLAVFGVVLTVVGGQSLTASGRIVGLAFAALSTCCAALYTVWMRGMSAHQDGLTALIIVQSTSCLIAFGATVCAKLLFQVDWTIGGTFVALVTIASGVIQYGAAYYLYVLGLKTTPASTAGIYLSLVPVFTIGLAFALLGETLRPAQWIGAVIVVASVIAVFATSNRAGGNSKSRAV